MSRKHYAYPTGIPRLVVLALVVSGVLLCVIEPSRSIERSSTKVTRANYELAARFTASDLRSRFTDTTVRPTWIEGGRRFWYAVRTGTAARFFMVDVGSRTKSEIAVDLRLVGPSLVEFTIEGQDYQYNTVTQELKRLDPRRFMYEPWQTPSPDGKTVAYARNHNLVLKSVGGQGPEKQITSDAEAFYSFAEPTDFYFTGEGKRRDDTLRVAEVFWSPDSKKLVATRRDVRHYSDMWVLNSLAAPSPELIAYKQRNPGEDPPRQEVWMYNAVTDSMMEVRADKWLPSIYEDIVWSGDSERLYMTRKSPDHLECELLEVDATTGEFRVVLAESIGALALTRPVVLLPGDGGFLWWSRRDGYGHYYLYDLQGNMKGRVTSGDFTAGEILGFDKKRGQIYFIANGRERGRNPYYDHLYRVNLDGTHLELLTYEDAHHEVYLSPSHDCFVDTYSRVDQPPTAVLLDVEGKLLMELERADITRLTDAGWKEPEMLKVKAADGTTDLWGVMWKPYDFDPGRKYPIVSFVYPGPQDELVPLTFVDALGNNAHLAQYGFIVIHFGNRGGSYKRSLEYSEYYRGNVRDYPVADYKAVIEDLARRYDWIDLDRVGIWGGSSGAYAAVTSMLTYPDFYKVCVARAGPHDPTIYHAWWSDEFQGMTRSVAEDGAVRWITEPAKGNLELAGNLKGHLLLIHSEMDQNVHPAHSARMARALMAADKRFDYFVVPGAGHGWGPNWPYVQQMIWTYFIHYLMGDDRGDVDMFWLGSLTSPVPRIIERGSLTTPVGVQAR